MSTTLNDAGQLLSKSADTLRVEFVAASNYADCGDETIQLQLAVVMIRQAVLKQGCVVWLSVFACLVRNTAHECTTRAQSPAVDVGKRGKLVYATDDRGNRIPDFSHCGYAGADRDVPNVPVRATVAPAAGDDGPRIQAAIDNVAQLPLGADGIRGAVLLLPGRFEISGQLRISASGVVLRGSGAGENGTTLFATGMDRRTLIRVHGIPDRKPVGNTHNVVDEYVPLGAVRLRLDATDSLRIGDSVFIARSSTFEWIQALGMDAFGVAWKPGTHNIRWDRVVTAIDGNVITLDAPVTTAIEARFGGATVQRYVWPSRISNVGVENIRLQSEYATDRPHDEEHSWFGVTMENAQNTWVRLAEFRHFAGGAVALWESTKWITVEDCIATEPISEVGGYRRHTFFTQGQLTLFLRCWSEHGRHDFAVGHCAVGPNAFVNCYASRALSDSGPIESWASGVLYDNVRIDGAGLNLMNRWAMPPGAGWSAANCVLWQCQAATMGVFRPPTANNWAIGVWAGLSGDGTFEGRSDFVRPVSLYQAQLHERRGAARAHDIGLGLADPIGSTNPTIAEAARFAEQSRRPARQLIDVIRERVRQVSGVRSQGSGVRDLASPTPDIRHPTLNIPPPAKRLRVQDGWLVADGKLVTGGSIQQMFWRGTTRPDEAPMYGSAITRFVPGRVGTGFTDDLKQVTEEMLGEDIAVFDHHYGLWYDRRRDDHTMGRQADGNVAPPFYEQPFARTGRGRAWDGLSKYDLTKFNPWYWQRLRDFARLCDERGFVLLHQNYFQHNILEAGAHWADCAWRPANNVNDIGLPEPPPYIGDKRIFLAHLFYDVSDPRRRALHRSYIRRCLDNFADCSNVIQMTSAEYAGPLEFTQFWLDTIIEWKREHGRDVLVGLSAPKDVQDAILTDPVRGPHVDVIDIRYWAYTANGGLYAPEGGRNLAPRQHLRQTRQQSGGFAAIVKAVREYRTRYPDKAVTYYADMNCPSGRDGWAVLIGGGSLPNVKLPVKLADVVATMRPINGIVSGSGQWCLGDSTGDFLIYNQNADAPLDVRLLNEQAAYRIHWIDAVTGGFASGNVVTAATFHRLRATGNVLWLARVNGD